MSRKAKQYISPNLISLNKIRDQLVKATETNKDSRVYQAGLAAILTEFEVELEGLVSKWQPIADEILREKQTEPVILDKVPSSSVTLGQTPTA
jgi:hypothetical protein